MKQHESVLRLNEVIEIVGLSRSSIYLAIKLGHFPQQIKLGQRAVGWLSTDIDTWLKERIRLRNDELNK